MERDNPDPDAEELLTYDHESSFEADPDPEPDRGEWDGVDITESDGPDLEAGDDLDTGAAISDRRDRS
jgi:hypothetical protein